jgi:hypothetical protein
LPGSELLSPQHFTTITPTSPELAYDRTHKLFLRSSFRSFEGLDITVQ